MKRFTAIIQVSFLVLGLFFYSPVTYSSKLVEISVVDKDYIYVFFKDGDVNFVDDGTGICAYTNVCEDASNSALVTYGNPLNTTNISNLANWKIKSTDDVSYGTAGKSPLQIYRKTKISGMSQESWSMANNDYNYDLAFEHGIFIKLPNSLQQGKTYTIEINSNTNSDKTVQTLTYDIFSLRSEAVKVNVVGYGQSSAIKAADLYMWMGDGAARDYSTFVGNKVFIYNVNTKSATEVGTVKFWKAKANETIHNHKMLQSDVWSADFTAFNTPGTYKLAIEGVGCSDTFKINGAIYYDPFAISVKGFFYMRIGQDNLNMTPVPRRPLWIPNTSPVDCKVYLTTMNPYHANWNSFSSGDAWDMPQDWVAYVKPGNPTNPNAYGGHSDALDWDRHLGHVSIIYDMLLPYILTNGSQSDDNLGIAESGNGIPDLLDEARNEVDFWLRLRDGKGYSHGLTNPIKNTNALYQAAPSAVAAWANAANAAMLSYSFQIAGKNSLMQVYRDSAVAAYNYAGSLTDQQLTKTQNVGYFTMSGKDFKLTAAAFLYNVTGESIYEKVLNTESRITSSTSEISNGGNGDSFSELYVVAGYLKTPRTVNYPSLYNNMKASVIYRAKQKEANYSQSRPSRRGSDNNIGWMQTEIGMQRTMIAHAVSPDGADKQLFEDAMVLEYDYSLGRNPLNRILMTTATTSLANERSIEQAYTSGWDDGTPGVHPGHTPYMNTFDWGGLIMGRPEWMAAKSYPTVFTGGANPTGMDWPMGEMYFNTRFVYAHSEFTPQQTMRGKTALYAYLYGINSPCEKPDLGSDQSICGVSSVVLNAGISSNGRSFVWTKDGNVISGASSNTYTASEPGVYEVTSNEGGCIQKSKTTLLKSIPDFDLGSTVTLCNPSSHLIKVNVAGTGLSYEWKKDGLLISGVDSASYRAIEAGDFSVTVSAGGCPSKSKNLLVNSSLIKVKHDTICGTGIAKLKVLDQGNYKWYAGLGTAEILTTGDSYLPMVSKNTTFYIEDAGKLQAHVGPVSPGNSNWGSWEDSYNHQYKFTTNVSLKLESVKVVATKGGKVNVHLYQTPTGNPVQSATVNVVEGETVINVGFELTPGTYYLNAAGSTAIMVMDNENGNYLKYPYSVAGVISITGIEPAWASTRYMHFYDWVVSSGNTCARTPINAIVRESSDSACNITFTDLAQNQVRFVYPNPTQGHIIFNDTYNYVIMNTMGKVLLSGNSNSVSIEQYPSGVYWIEIEGVKTRIVKY